MIVMASDSHGDVIKRLWPVLAKLALFTATLYVAASNATWLHDVM